jgi:hypothetical protein
MLADKLGILLQKELTRLQEYAKNALLAALDLHGPHCMNALFVKPALLDSLKMFPNVFHAH